MKWIALIATVVCLVVMLAPPASGQHVKAYKTSGPPHARAQ